MREERRRLSDEEGDAVREYKAMHEENFLSSWLGKVREVKKKGRLKWRGMKKERV